MIAKEYSIRGFGYAVAEAESANAQGQPSGEKVKILQITDAQSAMLFKFIMTVDEFDKFAENMQSGKLVVARSLATFNRNNGRG